MHDSEKGINSTKLPVLEDLPLLKRVLKYGALNGIPSTLLNVSMHSYDTLLLPSLIQKSNFH